ncbi:MAG: type II secretion system protein [Opitutales bacterium]
MKKKAFTLVELMLAAGLMTIIFTVVLSIAANVLNNWNRTSGTVKAMAQANVMLKMIQEDFECLVLKQDGGAWLQVDYTDDVGMLTGDDIRDKKPLAPPEIIFYSAPLDRPRYTKQEMSSDAYKRTPIAGSLCAMRYKVAVKSPFLESTGTETGDAAQTNAFYGFYRAIIDAQSTFEYALGEDIQGSTTVDVSNLLYNFWNRGSSQVLKEDGYRSMENLKTWSLSPENLLTTNVVDFRVSFTVKYLKNDGDPYDKYAYATIPAGVPFTFSDRLYLEKNLYTRSSQDSSFIYNVSPTEVENSTLAYAEVSLTILTPKGEKEMRNLMGFGTLTQEKFREIVLENSVTVAKRISFVGGDTL